VDTVNGSAKGGPSEAGACAEIMLVATTAMSESPFRAAPYDGIIGLGRKGMSINGGFSFIDHLGLSTSQGLKPQFALFHGPRFGEAAFGGYNHDRLASDLEWVPVAKPAEGYWQVEISSIRVGNRSIKLCEDGVCRGIIDSCTSNIGLPASMLADFQSIVHASEGEMQQAKQSCVGPDLHVTLIGGVELTLRAEDYMQTMQVDDAAVSTGQPICKPSITSLDLPEMFAGVIVLGEPLLRRYYTVYDWTHGSEKIGFGLAATVTQEEEFAVAAAEAVEDSLDAVASYAQIGGLKAALMLLQSFLIRVFTIMTLVMFGTQVLSSKQVASWYERTFARRRLLKEFNELAALVGYGDFPDGEECVICLGSCEDDPELLYGVHDCRSQSKAMMVQMGPSNCHGEEACKSLGLPRWRRLKCGHHFHETCIFEWFKRAKQCPVCRRHLKITDGEEHALELATEAQH
jgi:hypothetical protein